MQLATTEPEPFAQFVPLALLPLLRDSLSVLAPIQTARPLGSRMPVFVQLDTCLTPLTTVWCALSPIIKARLEFALYAELEPLRPLPGPPTVTALTRT